MAITYTVARKGSTLGSFPEKDVSDGLALGRFLPDDLAWCEGMADWQPISNLPGLQPGASPPPLPRAIGTLMPGHTHLGDDAGMRWLMPVGRSGWAIAAGYLGLFGVLIVPAPIALIVSIIAIWDIRRSKREAHPKHGMGRAVFGLVIGILGTLALLALVILSATVHH